MPRTARKNTRRVIISFVWTSSAMAIKTLVVGLNLIESRTFNQPAGLPQADTRLKAGRHRANTGNLGLPLIGDKISLTPSEPFCIYETLKLLSPHR